MQMTPARAVVLSAVLAALAATPALAQPGGQRGQGQGLMPHAKPFHRPFAGQGGGGHMDWAERQRLREDLRQHNRELRRDPEPGWEARRREAERLREQVRSGQMSREEALQRYRERFAAPQAPRGAIADRPPPQAPSAPPRIGAAPEPQPRQLEIERLREAVREGRMSPQEARERLREERLRRATESGRLTPEEREQLRRDILDANRNLERR